MQDMRVASKIHSLMTALGNAETNEEENNIDIEIIKVMDLLPKEVELIKVDSELRKLSYAISQGVTVDYDAVHRAKDKFDKLTKEIDEGIK